MEKSIHELKAEFAYLFMGEREKNNFSFEITVIIFKAYKKCCNSKTILKVHNF